MNLLNEAIARINDMLQGDDGQAYKEARKFVERVEAMPDSTKLKDDTIERLRALRLWHWRMCRQMQVAQEVAEAKHGVEAPNQARDLANFHMTQVQTLNEFFDVGDTAERDAAKG